MTAENRIRSLLRRAPALLLVMLFLLVAWSKAFAFVDELKSLADGISAYGVLLTIHSASSAMFFAIVAFLTIVRTEPIRRETRLIGWLLPTIVTVTMSGIAWVEPQGHPVGVMFIATLFVVIGTIFTVYSLRHLGRHFGVVSDVRGLVTSGPYRWVRHPLYGGETLTTIGLVIAVMSPFAVAVFAVGLGFQIWRAKTEEQALTAAFPEYREYAERTPMLIPMARLPLRMLGGTTAVK